MLIYILTTRGGFSRCLSSWVDSIDAKLVNGVSLHRDDFGVGEDLQNLVSLVLETLDHAKTMQHDIVRRDASSYPPPLVTARYYACGLGALRIRTIFYFAQAYVQSACHPGSSVMHWYRRLRLRIPHLIQHHIAVVDSRITVVLTCAFTVWDDHSLSPLLTDLTKPQ